MPKAGFFDKVVVFFAPILFTYFSSKFEVTLIDERTFETTGFAIGYSFKSVPVFRAADLFFVAMGFVKFVYIDEVAGTFLFGVMIAFF